MFAAIVREVKVIVAEKYLLSLLGFTCVGFAGIFSLQMYLMEDQNAGYKALGALVMGMAMIIASYVADNAASVLKLRYRILAVGFAVLLALNLKTEGIDVISWMWR